MTTKFFRRTIQRRTILSPEGHLSGRAATLSRVARLSCLLVLLTATFCVAAQNGITVSGLVVDAGTVTFNVSWDRNDPTMPAIWSDTVWVWVDYNDAGVMKRLPLITSGATLTATSAPGVAKVITDPGNDKGLWVLGNARKDGSFSATVQLLTATATAAGACAYASNYPPAGKYTSATQLTLTGTRPYDVVLKHTDGNTTVTRVEDDSFTIPPGYTLESFTDKTGAPGVIKCAASAVYDLKASATAFCTGATVTFALSNTASGRTYQLYKGSNVVNTLAGTDSPATFTGAFAGAGVYTAQVTAAEEYCAAAMTGTHEISENALPTAPTITKPADVCYNGGALVFTATDYTGVLEWTANGGGTQSGNSVTFANDAATGTKTVAARAAQTYSNALTCYSTTVTQSASVLPLPTVAPVTGGARCDAGEVNLSATPSADAVIDWYSAATDGTLLSSESDNFTTPSININTYYYAQARIKATGCVSASRTAVLAAITAIPTVPAKPLQDGPKCAGTAITFSATVPADATGLDWTGSVSGTGTSKSTATTAGNYSAQVRSYLTANGITCYSEYSSSVSGIIAVAPSTTPSLSVSQSTACVGTTITFTASGCSGSSCSWTGSFSGTGTTKTASSAGNYTAQVRSVSGSCYSSPSPSRYATITAPGGNNQSATCGCVSGTTNCGGICRTTTGYYYDDNGECTGDCNKRWRRELNQCGVVNDQYLKITDNTCTSGCCTPGKLGEAPTACGCEAGTRGCAGLCRANGSYTPVDGQNCTATQEEALDYANSKCGGYTGWQANVSQVTSPCYPQVPWYVRNIECRCGN